MNYSNNNKEKLNGIKLRDAENGLDISSKPEMSIDEILSSLMFLLKQDDIKSFVD